MEGMNKVILVGRIGSQPELIQDKAGRNFTKLSLGTERRWKGTEGNYESRTSWHRIMVWGRPAEHCTRKFRVGAPAMVEGYLSYFDVNTPNGETRKITSVTAERVTFLPFQKKDTETTDEALAVPGEDPSQASASELADPGLD